MLKAAEDCQNKKVGLWKEDEAFSKKNTRTIVFYGDASYRPDEVMKAANKEPRPLGAILEHVFNASYVSLHIKSLSVTVKVALTHLFTPHDTDAGLLEKGKLFLEKMLLHRSIGIKLARVDEQGNFTGVIHHPAGDIATEILK
jgi:hypothetical protein